MQRSVHSQENRRSTGASPVRTVAAAANGNEPKPKGLRHAMRWYSQMGRRVWSYEIINFLNDPLTRNGPSVGEFWGAPQDAEEQSMTTRRVARPAPPHRQKPTDYPAV